MVTCVSPTDWGSNQHLQCGPGDPKAQIKTPSRVALPEDGFAVSVSAGTWHSAVVTRGGQVLTWGRCHLNQLGTADPCAEGGKRGTPQPVMGRLKGRKVLSVAAGAAHTVVIVDPGSGTNAPHT